MSKKIIVVGSSNIDLIIKGYKIPKPGETVIGGKFFKAQGGKGANQAVAAARAGGNVLFISSVGNDTFGEEAISNYAKDGINTRFIKIDPEHPTGTALILINKDGENSISVTAGANGSLEKTDLTKAHAEIMRSEILLIQLEIPLKTVEAAIEMAVDLGIRVVLNPAPAQHLSDELLRKVNIITPNESEAELLTGICIKDEADAEKAAQILLDKGIENVLITMGKRGVFAATQEGSQFIPSFTVDAVETTAAGDVFNGALVATLTEEKALESAIQFACAAAAISVTKMGAQPSAPQKHEIEKFLNRNIQK